MSKQYYTPDNAVHRGGTGFPIYDYDLVENWAELDLNIRLAIVDVVLQTWVFGRYTTSIQKSINVIREFACHLSCKCKQAAKRCAAGYRRSRQVRDCAEVSPCEIVERGHPVGSEPLHNHDDPSPEFDPISMLPCMVSSEEWEVEAWIPY